MVSIKHKVTLKTKVAQEETPEAIESPKVTLKRKQPEVPVTSEPKQQLTSTPTTSKIEPQLAISTPQPEKNSNVGKVIGVFVAVIAIIAGIFFFMDKENESGNTNAPTEVIAQNTETKEGNNKSPVLGTANEEAVSESESVASNDPEKSVSVKPGGSPTNNGQAASTVPAKDNKVADLPAKQNPATVVGTTKQERSNARSKSVLSNVSKSYSVTSVPVSGDVEENARRVIRGDFGNGQERKDKLGSSYSEIQGKVNEMYRQGLVH